MAKVRGDHHHFAARQGEEVRRRFVVRAAHRIFEHTRFFDDDIEGSAGLEDPGPLHAVSADQTAAEICAISE